MDEMDKFAIRSNQHEKSLLSYMEQAFYI